MIDLPDTKEFCKGVVSIEMSRKSYENGIFIQNIQYINEYKYYLNV